MKKMLIILMLVTAGQALAQPPVTAQARSLLNWLIEAHHIRYLQPKTNDGVFYNNRYLTIKSLIKLDNEIDTSRSISNYLTEEEITTCQTAMPAMLTNWRIWHKQLPVVFTTGIKSELKLFDKQKTVHTFSNPLWLNKEASRVLIGEYFACGIACGRGDMLLCEFENGKWNLIARTIVTND